MLAGRVADRTISPPPSPGPGITAGRRRPCDHAVACPLAELENNLGISEKTLSEFIIDLAKGKKTVKEFKAALDANDAEFPMSLVETLWGIIQRLQVAVSPCLLSPVLEQCLAPLSVLHCSMTSQGSAISSATRK